MLKLTARSEYGLMLVHFLRSHIGQRYSIQSLSSELSIPSALVRKITKSLVDAGIILSFHGRNGGVECTQGEVSVFDVVSALGEGTSMVACNTGVICDKSASCKISPMLLRMNRGIESLLKLTKL